MEDRIKFVCDLKDGKIESLDERVVIAFAHKAMTLDVVAGINEYKGRLIALQQYYDNYKNSLLYNSFKKIMSSTFGQKLIMSLMEIEDLSSSCVFSSNSKAKNDLLFEKIERTQELIEENEKYLENLMKSKSGRK